MGYKIRIESGDWLKNAGIVGFVSVLRKNYEIDTNSIMKGDYLEFDSSYLENFEELYFKALIEKNEKSLSWYKIINYDSALSNILNKEKKTEKDLDTLNDIIDDLKSKSKLNSNSYKSAYLLLNDNFLEEQEKKLSKIKLKKKDNIDDFSSEINEQINIIFEIIEYLKKPEVKKIIAAKNVMYNIIQPFWTNISFLLKTNNKGHMYELYKNDFIKPILSYAESKEEKNKKYKYNCFTCDNKIEKLSKPFSFDLTWLVKVGVDMGRKSSHFWNLNGDAYICPVCNLIYSCIPLGFTIMKNKGIFINQNSSVKILVESNTLPTQGENFENIEQMSYFNILNSMEHYNIENLDKEFDNIQVVKIDGNNSSRPYSFNTLSPKIMKTLYYNRKILETLIKTRVKITDKYYINLYSEVIKRIYEGRNLLDLIDTLLYLNLNNKFKATGIIYNVLKINNYIWRGKDMVLDNDKKLDTKVNDYKSRKTKTTVFREYGLKLRMAYINKDIDNKIGGISYRILSALKTKDSAKFMDTVLNAYMYIKMQVPKDLSDLLVNDMTLQQLGYAFVIGLQGADNIKENMNREGEIQNEK